MDGEKRELGPGMTAEGWIVVSGDHMFWIHPKSSRCVTVDPIPWGNCSGIPSVGDAPADPKTPGYCVSCRIHDDLGNPVHGDAVWVESYAEAVRWARWLRREIIAEHPPAPKHYQLGFDDPSFDQVAAR